MAVKQVARSIKSPELQKAIDDFVAMVNKGNLNTDALRVVNKVLDEQAIENLTGEYIVRCDYCHLVAFGVKTASAYLGAYTICEQCIQYFSFCEPCHCFVLASDINNPTHKHNVAINAQALFPQDVDVAVWNADIMATNHQFFLKTKEEHAIVKRNKDTRWATLRAAHSEPPLRFFGVELEVEKKPCVPPDLLQRTRDLLGDFVLVKHDGSLGDHGKNGFEIVSVPATLNYHKQGTWKQFFGSLGDFFMYNPPTAGLHVHMGTATVNDLTVAKMAFFVNSLKNREFIESLADRPLGVVSPNGKIYAQVNNEWKLTNLMQLRQHNPDCPWNPKNKKTSYHYAHVPGGGVAKDTAGHPIIASIVPIGLHVRAACKCPRGKYHTDKYWAFNLMTKRDTIEFRIFRGIVNEKFLYSALEFVDAVADFCSDTPPNKINYEDFLAWICCYNSSGQTKKYPNLSRLLIDKGWIDPPKERQALA